MASPTCPTSSALEEFLLGKLRRNQQLSVADHLAVCPRCARVVESMSANDELTLALSNQRQRTTVVVKLPQLAKAINSAKELKSERI